LSPGAPIRPITQKERRTAGCVLGGIDLTPICHEE
jgi:hypothetical protein